jgi:BlaI family penicillinase repressor
MPENPPSGRAPRHAILDLAPLELDCMTVVWSLGAGTVRDIQDKLMATRPRAYTTVMTIMDRLAQKGIVSRKKVGRAYRYQANLSSDDARNSAVQKVVAGFFNGSTEALASHLESSRRAVAKVEVVQPAVMENVVAAVVVLSPVLMEAPADDSDSDRDRLDESLL